MTEDFSPTDSGRQTIRRKPKSLIGQKVDQYLILARIGKGAAGSVYLAQDTSLGRRAALKFLPTVGPDSENARDRILSEARLAAALDHPYICKVYSVGEYKDQAYIGMEFIEGRTLKERLKQGPLPIKQALKTGIEIAEALVKAHEGGIVHTDLKPGNLAYTPEGHIKVLDFGLAIRLPELLEEDETEDSIPVLRGTPAYMSPEQIVGMTLDARSDIFSLGVVLYEMIAGNHPFRRASVLETLVAIRESLQDPLRMYTPNCPAELEIVVSRMLSKGREQRYDSVRDVLTDLVRISDARSRTSLGESEALSLAVLPFVNLSPDPDYEYFTDGITEEIITRLSEASGLRVISRTSMMRYKNSNKDLRTIGVELGVDAVLEGSIRREGSHLRIVCKLVEVPSEKQIWAEIYDRQVADLIAVQGEVTNEIASALKTGFIVSERKKPGNGKTSSLETYNLYLKGRFFQKRMSAEDLDKAIRCFEQVLERDPLCAPALAGLSTCYADAGHFGYMSEKEAYFKARIAAQKALELDSDLPEAHVSYGFVRFYDWEWSDAERAFQRAIKINPNYVDAHVLYSWCLVPLARWREALREARAALHVDPLSVLASVNLGWVLLCMAHFEEAIEHFEATIEIDPSNRYARSLLAFALQGKGKPDDAIAVLEKWAWTKPLLGWAYAGTGRMEKATRLLEEVINPSGDESCSPAQIALIYLLLDDIENGVTWLERAFENHDTQLIHLRANVLAARYFTHPRVEKIFEKMGLEPKIERVYQRMEGYLASPRILSEISEAARSYR